MWEANDECRGCLLLQTLRVLDVCYIPGTSNDQTLKEIETTKGLNKMIILSFVIYFNVQHDLDHNACNTNIMTDVYGVVLQKRQSEEEMEIN